MYTYTIGRYLLFSSVYSLMTLEEGSNTQVLANGALFSNLHLDILCLILMSSRKTDQWVEVQGRRKCVLDTNTQKNDKTK